MIVNRPRYALNTEKTLKKDVLIKSCRKRTASLFSSRSFIGKASSCKVNRTRLLVYLCLRQPLCTYSFCDTWHSNCKNSTFSPCFCKSAVSICHNYSTARLSISWNTIIKYNIQSISVNKPFWQHAGKHPVDSEIFSRLLRNPFDSWTFGASSWFLLTIFTSNRIWCWVQLTFKSQ